MIYVEKERKKAMRQSKSWVNVKAEVERTPVV